MRPADLARLAGLDDAVLSRILNRSRKPALETLQAIAKALRLPVDEVYRAAGILPKVTAKDAYIRRIEEKLAKIDDERDRATIEKLIDTLSPDENKPIYRRGETS